jgi:hypothetical protein
LHPKKAVQSVLGWWLFSRFFSKKSHFCHHFDFWLPFWIFESFSENIKAVGKNGKKIVSDLLEFFKNKTAEIRHLTPPF